MRERVSYVLPRQIKASIEYMKTLDKKNGTNNIYVWAMIQYLPVGVSELFSEDDINKFESYLVKEYS